jgi:hypothetical protein
MIAKTTDTNYTNAPLTTVRLAIRNWLGMYSVRNAIGNTGLIQLENTASYRQGWRTCFDRAESIS